MVVFPFPWTVSVAEYDSSEVLGRLFALLPFGWILLSRFFEILVGEKFVSPFRKRLFYLIAKTLTEFHLCFNFFRKKKTG